MLAPLGGDGERELPPGRAGSFQSSGRVGASKSRAADDFWYSGNQASAAGLTIAQGMSARAGVDRSGQPCK